MIQLLLFCIAICAGTYGALSGNLASLGTATVVTLLAANNLFGRLAQQQESQQILANTVKQYRWLILAIFALLLASLATRQFLQNEFDFTSGYLWLAGLALMISAGYIHDWQVKGSENIIEAGDTDTPTPARIFDRTDWLLAGAITGVALALRLYRLNDFLPTMHGDEGEMGMLALLALHGPTSGISPMPLPLFTTAFLDHPTLFHYIQAGAMWLFGESLTGLRTLSAIFGALCVPVVYGIGRVGWGRVAGITAGWLLAISHFHIQYSRIALNNIESVWFMAFFILVMLLAAEQTYRTQTLAFDGNPQRGRLIGPLVPYTWAGLAMGLSQYFYYGSRLLPAVAAPLLLFLLVKRKVTFAQLLILAVAIFVAYAPLAAHYSRNLPAFLNRTQGVSILNPEGMAHTLGPQAVWPDDIPQLIWEQVQRNADLFARGGDKSAFYLADLGAFDPITVALFWLGLGVVLARAYRFQEFAILAWFGLGVVLAGVITNDAPNGPRLIVGITAIYVIGGILLQRLFNFVQPIWPTGSRWGAMGIALLIAVLTLQINFTTYFVTYARSKPNLMPISLASDIHALGNQNKFYLFGAPHFYANYSTLRFIALGTERYDVDQVDELPTLAQTQTAKQGVVVIFLPHRLAEIEAVKTRLPGGTLQEHFNDMRNLMYVIYQIPSPLAQAADSQPPTERLSTPTTILSPLDRQEPSPLQRNSTPIAR